MDINTPSSAIIGTNQLQSVTNITDYPQDQSQGSNNFALEITAQEYIQSIHQLETEAGAYAPHLWEKIQGLALAYYNQGKNEEAVAIFRRALHVHRVNNGLYNIEQVPILQQMIGNHIILENFSLADDQQYYLYRTRLHNYKPGDPQFLQTLREYAHWQREAYLLEIGKDIHRRLISMYELQMQALKLVEHTYGSNDKSILPILEDLLITQYLIASYSEQVESESPKMKYDKIEFDFLRLSSYSRGVDFLARVIAIHDADPHANIYTKVDAVVALGDWYQWNRKRSEAFKMYAKAHHLLAEKEGGGDRINAIFGRPQALPTTGAFDSGLAIRKGKSKGYVTAQFAVTDYGVASGISFLDTQVQTETKHYNSNRRRIRKKLKNILFRPRFENATPIITKGVIHRYEFYY